MRKAIIQVGDNRISYDGLKWRAVSGERAEGLAELMESFEFLYKRNADTQPDYLYNIALEAARQFNGKVIECPRHPPSLEMV